jgi:alpha-1,3-glucan synthase
MADLLAFRGYLNETVPFKQSEHDVEWKSDLRYLDFSFGNTYNESCEYPRFWNETGNRVLSSIDPEFAKLHGCYESDFDQASAPIHSDCFVNLANCD